METYKILRYIVISSEIIAFIVGLYYYHKKPLQLSKSFILYLGILSMLEITGTYLIGTKLWDLNASLYKYIAFPFQFTFLFWYLSKNINVKRRKLLLLVSIIIYIVSWVLEYEFISKQKHGWMSLSFTVASLNLILLIFVYFFKLIKSEEILKFYDKQSFWICFGILIHYLGSFPFFGMFNYLYQKSPELHLIYFQIVLLLATTMYLLFAASFIWGKEK
jgi:hypothetical protein